MFDPNQPRIPKHHHGGGRWTRGGYGMLSDVGMLRPRDDDEDSAQPTLADLPHYAWQQDPLQRDRPVYPAVSGGPPTQDPVGGGAAAAMGGWSLFNWPRGGISTEEARGWDEYERLSEQNSPNRRATIIFKVRASFAKTETMCSNLKACEVSPATRLEKVARRWTK